MNKQLKRRKQRQPVATTRSVEALTIGWMMMVFTALACELIALLSWLYLVQVDRQAAAIQLMCNLFIFAAAVIGLFSLLVCPVVLRSRRVPPPRSIVVFSLVVGFAPLIALMLLSIR